MSLSDLREQVFWTEADRAELDLLAFEFTRAAWIHRDGCSICRTGGPWCAPLRETLDGLLDWREGRVLRSRAAWLRARQSLHEERAA